jgi:hypothetical protein
LTREVTLTLDVAPRQRYASRVPLKTPSSLAVPRRRRHARSGRPATAAGALGAVLVALALGGCGSSGSNATTQATTVATAPTTTAATTTTTVSTTAAAPARPRRRRARTAPVHHRAAAPRPQTTPAPAPPPSSSTPHPQAAAPRPAAKRVRPQGPIAHPIEETAQLVLVSSPGPGRYEQQGTVTGTFDGTMTLNARVTDAGVVVDFTANVNGGIVRGHGLAIPTIHSGSPVATLKGTAVITGGTGTFAHVRSSKLTVGGTAVLPSGAKATVHLTGTVTY